MKIDKAMLDTKMVNLGFRENINGTHMIRRAVEMWEPGMMWSKEIYPALAKEFGTTAQRVERAMRHAIESAWERGSTAYQCETFGHSVRADVGRPTVSECVGRLAWVCARED